MSSSRIPYYEVIVLFWQNISMGFFYLIKLLLHYSISISTVTCVFHAGVKILIHVINVGLAKSPFKWGMDE